MVKTVITALCAIVLAGGLAAAAGRSAPPEGEWSGQGRWVGTDGSTGTYDASVTITGDVMESKYDYERQGESTEDSFRTRLVAEGSGFFKLVDDGGATVGRMACLDATCTYTVDRKGFSMSETLRAEQGVLERFGTKSMKGYSVTWKETLDPR